MILLKNLYIKTDFNCTIFVVVFIKTTNELKFAIACMATSTNRTDARLHPLFISKEKKILFNFDQSIFDVNETIILSRFREADGMLEISFFLLCTEFVLTTKTNSYDEICFGA